MFKTLLRYQGVLFLLVINAFIIYYYFQHPGQFNTIVWICLRILPMHLVILIPGFLGYSSSVIFLVVRTLADAGMYAITHYSSNKQQL